MRYVALATDYDGTLATHGRVGGSTIEALEQLRASGRRLLLVTGRELPDLKTVFERMDLFERVVAENGALLYRPATNEEIPLSEAPPEAFIALLKRMGVPFSVGRSIVATHEPHHTEVLEAVKQLELELHVIFNKGAVMVLPSGVNKATGLRCALEEMGLSEHNVVAVGDAENDHAFLSACEFAVAVSNAVDTLKERADWVTEGARGAAVEELVREIIEDDLQKRDRKLHRHCIVLGHNVDPSSLEADSAEIRIWPQRGSVLIAGPSGSGKSTAATALIDRLIEQHYQFCLIDPEGDYENLPSAVVMGTATTAPTPAQVLKTLEKPGESVVANLLGMPLADRPLFFAALLPGILELRARSGRPHYLVVDEAHHLLPSSWVPATGVVPQALAGMMLITVHPDSVARAALNPVDTVIVVGKEPAQTFKNFAKAIEEEGPRLANNELPAQTVAVWSRGLNQEVVLVKVKPSEIERQRHTRKYAEGELPPDRSFYFRGPKEALNLRAQNLTTFLQIAEGVDDATWMHHLQKGDYSEWLRRFIKDKELAEEVSAIERDQAVDAQSSRKNIKDAIEKRYTAAA